jgi:hypothetical protein
MQKYKWQWRRGFNNNSYFEFMKAEAEVQSEAEAEGFSPVSKTDPQSQVGEPNARENETEATAERTVEKRFAGLELNESAMEFCLATSRNTEEPDFQWKKDEIVLTLTLMSPKADK